MKSFGMKINLRGGVDKLSSIATILHNTKKGVK